MIGTSERENCRGCSRPDRDTVSLGEAVGMAASASEYLAFSRATAAAWPASVPNPTTVTPVPIAPTSASWAAVAMAASTEAPAGACPWNA